MQFILNGPVTRYETSKWVQTYAFYLRLQSFNRNVWSKEKELASARPAPSSTVVPILPGQLHPEEPCVPSSTSQIDPN